MVYSLREPPKPGAPVEIDVYNWGDQCGAVYDWDAERCPEPATGSLLTDRALVANLRSMGGCRAER